MIFILLFLCLYCFRVAIFKQAKLNFASVIRKIILLYIPDSSTSSKLIQIDRHTTKYMIEYSQLHTYLKKVSWHLMNVIKFLVCCLYVMGNTYVTVFWKTNHLHTFHNSRNANLKYWMQHASLVVQCSHARYLA